MYVVFILASDDVHVLGTDDATTCHIVVLIHTGMLLHINMISH